MTNIVITAESGWSMVANDGGGGDGRPNGGTTSTIKRCTAEHKGRDLFLRRMNEIAMGCVALNSTQPLLCFFLLGPRRLLVVVVAIAELKKRSKLS